MEYIRYVNNQAHQTLNNELITEMEIVIWKEKITRIKDRLYEYKEKITRNSRKPTNVGFFHYTVFSVTTGFLFVDKTIKPG